MKKILKLIGAIFVFVFAGAFYLIYFMSIIIGKIILLIHAAISNRKSIYNIKDLDSMSGLEFEEAFAKILRYNDYQNVKVTQGSGDFGVDVLATKNNIKYAFQCKLYSNKVGVESVQQALSGCTYYGYDKAIVVTNNYFTPQALKLASKTNIELWDRNKLLKLNTASTNKTIQESNNSNPLTITLDIDSLEPLYHKGDILQIELTNELVPGDIGIFNIGIDNYIGIYNTDSIISLNDSYSDISFNPNTDSIYAKIVGKL